MQFSFSSLTLVHHPSMALLHCRTTWGSFRGLLNSVWQLNRVENYVPNVSPETPPSVCSVCGFKGATVMPLDCVMLRPEAARNQPLQPPDFDKYERRLMVACSPECQLVNQSRMLVNVHKILRHLEAKERGGAALCPSALYAEWSSIQSLTMRSTVLRLLLVRALQIISFPRFFKFGRFLIL